MGDTSEMKGKLSDTHSIMSDDNEAKRDSAATSDATSDASSDSSDDESAKVPRGKASVPRGNAISSPWRRLFLQNRNLEHGLKLKKVEKEQVVQLTDSDVLDTKCIWDATLIGYVVGKPTDAKDIDALRRTWNISFNYMKHPSGWSIFKFDTEEQKQSILANGPYSSAGFPWIIKDIPAYFSFGDDSFNYIPVWVTLPGLPMECWSESALSKIASQIGDPITTDKCTALKFRVSFARILVEVDARKELVRSVPIKMPNGDLHDQSVLYEFEPKLCATCNRVGHSTSDCRSTKKPRGMRVGAASRRNNAITESMKFAKPYAQPCLIVTRPDEVEEDIAPKESGPTEGASFGPSPSEAYSKKAATAAKGHAANSAKGLAVNAAAKGVVSSAAQKIAANAPNAAKEIGANAATAAREIGANAPTAAKEIGANAPTAARKGHAANAPIPAKGTAEISAKGHAASVANAPTAAMEFVANAPTAVKEIVAITPTAAKPNVPPTQNQFESLGVVGEILQQAIQPTPSKGASTSKKNKKGKN